MDSILFSAPSQITDYSFSFTDFDLDVEIPKPENDISINIPELGNFLSNMNFITETLRIESYDIQYIILHGFSSDKTIFTLTEYFDKCKFIFIDIGKHYFKNGNEQHDIMGDIGYLKYSYFNQQSSRDKKLIQFFSRKKNDFTIIDRNAQNEEGANIGNYVDIIKNGKYKIYVIENYLSYELSSQLKKLEKCLFISNTHYGNNPSDSSIIIKNSMIYNTINLINPVRTLINFTFPKGGNQLSPVVTKSLDVKMAKEKYNNDMIQQYLKNKHIFFASHILPKPYSSQIMMEITRADALPKAYDFLKINQSMNYYQTYIRQYGFFNTEENYANTIYDKSLMIDHCADCKFMIDYFIKYIVYKQKDIDEYDKFIVLNKNIIYILRQIIGIKNLSNASCTHGIYYNRLKNIDRYNNYIRELSSGLKRYEKVFYKQVIKPDIKYNKAAIVANIEKAVNKIEMRQICILKILFDIDDPKFDDKLFLKGDKDSSFMNLEKIISQQQCGISLPMIQGEYFSRQFISFVRESSFSNVVFFGMTKYDIFFETKLMTRLQAEGIYYERKNIIGINSSYVSPSTLIVVCLNEIPSVQYMIRKSMIEKYERNAIIFFTKEIPKIYNSPYIRDSDSNSVKIETYTPLFTKIIYPGQFIIDKYEIDYQLSEFILPNLPYVLMKRSKEKITIDSVKNYNKYQRLYLIYSEEKILPNLEMMVEVSKGSNIYGLKSLRNKKCGDVFYYFLFTEGEIRIKNIFHKLFYQDYPVVNYFNKYDIFGWSKMLEMDRKYFRGVTPRKVYELLNIQPITKKIIMENISRVSDT